MNEIQMVKTINNRVTEIKQNVFEIDTRALGKKSKRLVNVLKKKNVLKPYSTFNYKVERIVINENDFMQRFFEADSEVTRMVGKGGEILLIGIDDYNEMMRTSYDNGFSFRGGYYNSINGQNSFMNLTVHVIHWMKGMLILPKDKLKEIF